MKLDVTWRTPDGRLRCGEEGWEEGGGAAVCG